MQTRIEGPLLGKASVCEPILRSLPEWFRIKEANLRYLSDIERLPTFIAMIEGEPIGFLTLKQHNQYTEEILIMGVIPDLHRKGIGNALLFRAEEYLRQKKVEYLQVKTLSSSNPDTNYANTRALYFSLGFRPLEEFKDLWDEQNPALLMVKKLC